MDLRGYAVIGALLVCGSAACGSEAGRAVVDQGTVLESVPQTPAPTTASASGRCVHPTTPGQAGGLELTVGSPAPCAIGADTSVTVRNSTSTTCTSDVVATLTRGERYLFSSESGYGGEKGHWAPAASDIVEGVGIIEYPPGDRSWSISLSPLLAGPQTMTLPIYCGPETLTLTATFTIGPL